MFLQRRSLHAVFCLDASQRKMRPGVIGFDPQSFVEGIHCLLIITPPAQDLAQPGMGLVVIRLEPNSHFEGISGPGKVVHKQVNDPQAEVRFRQLRIEADSLLAGLQGLLLTPQIAQSRRQVHIGLGIFGPEANSRLQGFQGFPMAAKVR